MVVVAEKGLGAVFDSVVVTVCMVDIGVFVVKEDVVVDGKLVVGMDLACLVIFVVGIAIVSVMMVDVDRVAAEFNTVVFAVGKVVTDAVVRKLDVIIDGILVVVINIYVFGIDVVGGGDCVIVVVDGIDVVATGKVVVVIGKVVVGLGVVVAGVDNSVIGLVDVKEGVVNANGVEVVVGIGVVKVVVVFRLVVVDGGLYVFVNCEDVIADDKVVVVIGVIVVGVIIIAFCVVVVVGELIDDRVIS